MPFRGIATAITPTVAVAIAIAIPPTLQSGFQRGRPLCFLYADLVPETLGGDDGDLVADSLVGLEVEGEAGIVPLDDDLGGLLDGLGTYATHVGGVLVIVLGDGWKCSFFC